MYSSSIMATLFYTRFQGPLGPSDWDHYFSLLPPDQQERNKRYRRWEDRHSHLLGRMLLYFSLKEAGYAGNPLYDIRYDAYSRPFLNDEIDFNISHSGQYIVCAWGIQLRLGIDIEQYREVALRDFQDIMSAGQWDDIHRADSPCRAFYNYWAMKESVIKADGRGLSIPLAGLEIRENIVHLDHIQWYLKSLEIDESYSVCLACNVE